MMHFSQGQVLGRYELLLPVARGGMAEVWAARLHGSRGFRKLVAIKTVLPGVIDDTRMEQMFLAEAELASRIEHPNVVHTLELGEHCGALYLVLEWVDGQSLSSLLTQASSHGGMPLSIAVNLVGQACKGLHAAHELKDENGILVGVVHRDISPQNVLVNFSGTVKVVDFGIAKATQGASTMTEAGEVKGKLAYMAPEQLRGSEGVDRRADIFSMGTLLYAMTTGRHPFRGEHPSATLKNITGRESVPPPSAHVENYPSPLEEVVLTALKKDPKDRYNTAYDMLQALERAMPEALERSFDARVAEFVTKVAGQSGSERHQRIREAGEILDRIRSKSGTMLEPTSPSSLSALAIDGSNLQHQTLSIVAGTTQPSPLPPRLAGNGKLWVIAAGAVVAGTVLGLVLARDPAPNQLSSGSMAPPGEFVSVEPLSPPAPSVTNRARETSAAAEAATGVEADAVAAPAPAPAASSAEPPTPRRRVVVRAAPRAAAKPEKTAVETVEPAPATPAPAPRARETAKPKAGDAWDPSSFGARQ